MPPPPLQLPNAFLVALDRSFMTIHAVSPEEVLEEGDILWFAGAKTGVGFPDVLMWGRATQMDKAVA